MGIIDTIFKKTAEQNFKEGLEFGDLGQYNEALASFDKVIESNPSVSEAWNNRGIVLINLGRYEEAIVSYEKAIENNPRDSTAWLNRGVALENLRRYEEAVASYEKATNFEYGNAIAWKYHGDALKKLGRYKEASESYEKAIRYKPDYDLAKTNLQNVEKIVREEEDREILSRCIEEIESFGLLPSQIKKSVQQPNSLTYPDEVIALIDQLNEFLATARPQIKLVLSCKNLALSTWGKAKFSITNKGSAHARKVTFEFTEDVEVRRNTPVDVSSGETKKIEISIIAKDKGTIPLDITVTYKDARDKKYSDKFDFDVEVTEN
jgi:tetratricopeptide (TPR) repeat protein